MHIFRLHLLIKHNKINTKDNFLLIIKELRTMPLLIRITNAINL